MDTSLSQPPEDKLPIYVPDSSGCSYISDSALAETIPSRFNGIALSETTPLINCSDCVVCRISVQQTQNATVTHFINKTAIASETPAQISAWRMAFLEGITAGTFLFRPGGVSQVATCDWNWYSVNCNYYRAIFTNAILSVAKRVFFKKMELFTNSLLIVSLTLNSSFLRKNSKNSTS